MVIVLFKRFEFGAQFDGAPILFKVTAEDTLECWLTAKSWIGLSQEIQLVLCQKEATHIRNRRSWMNVFEHLKLLDDLECSWFILPERNGRSTPVMNFWDIQKVENFKRARLLYGSL